MTLCRFSPAACFIRLTNSSIFFSATILKPPAFLRSRRCELRKLPASAGAAAAGTASAKSSEPAATASETTTPAIAAATPAACSEQKHPEQDLAQRGQQDDQQNYAK